MVRRADRLVVDATHQPAGFVVGSADVVG